MDKLASHTAKIDICIGDSDKERSDIILDLVNREKMKCLQFADTNPEIVLPDSLDSDLDTVVFPSDSTTVLISRSRGTAALDLDSPTIQTKSRPCGLSHPFRVK